MIRLFDDFERTHLGPASVGESHYEYLNRSCRPEAVQARELSERWFEEYSRDAPKCDVENLRSRFRNKRYKQHYAAWFELLTHQTLVRLGFSVSVHPDLPGTTHHPDFAASSDASDILVEATVVAPDNDPLMVSPFEADAEIKFAQLELANFTARIVKVSGTLDRPLKSREIKQKFERFVTEHDPDVVQQDIDHHGYSVLPQKTIRFGEWKILVELLPCPPGKRAPRQARVASWPRTAMYDSSVPQVREKIQKKLRDYGSTEKPLVLAVNVHNLGGFDVNIDGHEVLFNKDGIWKPQRSLSRNEPLAVFFFTNTNSYTVQSTQACLYVNPSISPDDLPPTMLWLPRVQGANGTERIGGETIPRILKLV